MTRRKRPKVERETLSFIAAARRFIRAAGARVANGDEPELAALLGLQVDLDAAIQVAVDGQRAAGRSWAHIALATGTSRQAAFKRWGGRELVLMNMNSRYGRFATGRALQGGPLEPTPQGDYVSAYPAELIGETDSIRGAR